MEFWIINYNISDYKSKTKLYFQEIKLECEYFARFHWKVRSYIDRFSLDSHVKELHRPVLSNRI